MRLELTRVGLLAELANHYTTRGALVIYKALCFDVVQGRMNGAPNEQLTGMSALSNKENMWQKTFYSFFISVLVNTSPVTIQQTIVCVCVCVVCVCVCV